MAQEDKGLVIRGLLLFAAIGLIVLIVLSILFWRPQPSVTETTPTSEGQIVALVTPAVTMFPAGFSWGAAFLVAETMPSASGWDIRYNAAATLARRGSDSVPWHLLREMLDEKQQRRNNHMRMPDGREVVDETVARATTLSALRALTAWHEKRREANDTQAPTELREIYAMVDALTQSPYMEVRGQAEKAKATFFR